MGSLRLSLGKPQQGTIASKLRQQQHRRHPLLLTPVSPMLNSRGLLPSGAQHGYSVAHCVVTRAVVHEGLRVTTVTPVESRSLRLQPGGEVSVRHVPHGGGRMHEANALGANAVVWVTVKVMLVAPMKTRNWMQTTPTLRLQGFLWYGGAVGMIQDGVQVRLVLSLRVLHRRLLLTTNLNNLKTPSVHWQAVLQERLPYRLSMTWEAVT